jgi:hypothetical protein
MEPDVQEIKRTLDVLFRPGETIELRCVGHRTLNGYYRNIEKLAEDAATLNDSSFNPSQNAYSCLNPVDPELFARRADTFGNAQRGDAVKDSDVLFRRWLLVDIDPVRPSGTSATNQQKQAAFDLATHLYPWLCERLGDSCIVCADSGNGAHMLIHLPDMPVNQETRWTCERVLQHLSDQFSNNYPRTNSGATANGQRR